MCRFWTRLLLSLALWSGGLGLAGVLADHEPIVLASALLPAAREKLPDGPRVEFVRLRKGRRRRKAIGPQIVHTYKFALASGEFVHLRFEQESVDIAVDLFDPLQRHLLRVDTINGSHGPEDVPFVANANGIYEIRVSSNTLGSYSVMLITSRNATARDRTLSSSVLAYFRGREASLAGRPRAEIESRYLEAARLAGEVGETLHRADAYFRLGDLQCSENRLPDCRDSYLRALALYEDNKNLAQQAVVLSELGLLMKTSGQGDRAADFYQRAIRLAREVGDSATDATASLNYGSLLVREGNFEAALQNAEHSLDLNRKIGRPLEEVRSLNECGRVYTSMGKIDKALSFHAEAHRILQSHHDPLRAAETLVHIGDAYREGNQVPLAISYYLQALDLFKKQNSLSMEASTLNNLSIAFYHAMRYQEALGASLRATQIFQELRQTAEESAGWANVGWVQIDLGNLSQSLEAFETALSLSKATDLRPSEAAAYFGMAWAERRGNNPISAEKNARKAIDIIESLRQRANTPILRTSIFGRRINFYEFLVDLLMEQHQVRPGMSHDTEAFEASERARARTLLESFGERSTASVLSLAEIQHRVLDHDTILLEYHLGDAKSFLWAVTPESSASFELPGRARIEGLAREVIDLQKRSYAREKLQEAVRKTRELAQMLLGPVATRLGNKTLLFVVPPSLQGLSFAAFPEFLGPEDDEAVSSWPSPLILRHAVVTAPSASVIGALRAHRAVQGGPHRLLATIYDPVYRGDDERLSAITGHLLPDTSDSFQRLRYSGKEATQIIKLAGTSQVLKLSGVDANRKAILDGVLQDYRYLHFSVHGDPNLKDAELSSLVLSALSSQGTPIDPFLRARDIQKLSLSADLVVLSACGSGLGTRFPGEGIVGLPHAFLSAGASGVIVSLWEVDDLAASNFMPRLYSNLLEKGLRPAEALRQAQVAMWKQRRWNAPAYWAGFVGMGEWR